VSTLIDGRTRQWIAAAAFWTFVILAALTALTPVSPAPPGLTPHWSTGLRHALAVWAAWALLAAAIIFVDRRLPAARESLVPRLLLHLPLSLVFTVAFAWLHKTVTAIAGGPVAADGGWLGGLLPQPLPPGAWLIYWVIVAGYIALDYQDQMRGRTHRVAELERLLAQSRIETLRTQLNPHFLFNALNAISAHVEGAPRTARWMLEQLGDLLRLSLDHADEQEITLQQELAFIDRYLKLQKIRFDNRLDVIVDVEPPALRALVPTFILQPLLENSIRHGIARRSTAGLIEIQAWQEQGALHLSVRDDGPGLPGNWDPEKGLGVGLKNTRERLRRLYGDAQTFEIAGIEGSGVRVDLTLPYRENTG
jgi:signal transduction histidine kinase